MQIKRIRPRSLAKMLALINGVIGLIIGAVISVLGFAASGSDGGGFNHLIGVAAIIYMPLFYGFMGVITGYLSAWIYNGAAKRVGGIEIETE